MRSPYQCAPESQAQHLSSRSSAFKPHFSKSPRSLATYIEVDGSHSRTAGLIVYGCYSCQRSRQIAAWISLCENGDFHGHDKSCETEQHPKLPRLDRALGIA